MENKEQILKFLYTQKSRKTLTLIDGTVIKGGETFESTKSNIPTGFMDLVKIISIADSPAAIRENTNTMVRNKKPVVVLEEKDEIKTGNEEAIDDPIEEIVPEVKAEETSTEPKPVFTAKHAGGGKYNVLDADGNVMNEKLLTKTAATLMIDQLQA